MAALHFTTIPCEPYTAHKVQRKPYFCNICPCANDIVYDRFELFYSIYEVVVRKELWVNVSVAIYSNTLIVMFKFLFFLFVLSSINLSECCVYPLT